MKKSYYLKASVLPLTQRVGQLIMGYFGEDGLPQIERLVRKGIIGTILVGYSETPGPGSTLELTTHLQSLSPLPLLFAADFEQGAGRHVPGATYLPSNMAIGATGSSVLARKAGVITAREARAMGVQMPIAPVLDCNSNPLNPVINTRSFGEDPALVSRLGIAFIKGCQGERAAAVAKHFPGHGDTATDSHLDMPTVPHSRSRLMKVELEPFRRAIKSGVKCVMVGHLHVPAFDRTPGLPATMSYPLVTGLLRQKLGFDGVIVTDAMAMKAVSAHFPAVKADIMALEAGCDIIIGEVAERTHASIMGAVRSGRVSEKTVTERAARVLALKDWLGLGKGVQPVEARAKSTVGSAAHTKTAMDIARAAVTVARDDGTLRKVNPDRSSLCLALPRQDRDAVLGLASLKTILKEKYPRVRYQEAVQDTVAVRGATAGVKLRVAVVVLFAPVAAYNPSSSRVSPDELQVIERIARLTDVIAVSFGNPYVLPQLRNVRSLIAAYSCCPACVEATLDVIFGKAKARGRLPVCLPGL